MKNSSFPPNKPVARKNILKEEEAGTCAVISKQKDSNAKTSFALECEKEEKNSSKALVKGDIISPSKDLINRSNSEDKKISSFKNTPDNSVSLSKLKKSLKDNENTNMQDKDNIPDNCKAKEIETTYLSVKSGTSNNLNQKGQSDQNSLNSSLEELEIEEKEQPKKDVSGSGAVNLSNDKRVATTDSSDNELKDSATNSLSEIELEERRLERKREMDREFDRLLKSTKPSNSGEPVKESFMKSPQHVNNKMSLPTDSSPANFRAKNDIINSNKEKSHKKSGGGSCEKIVTVERRKSEGKNEISSVVSKKEDSCKLLSSNSKPCNEPTETVCRNCKTESQIEKKNEYKTSVNNNANNKSVIDSSPSKLNHKIPQVHKNCHNSEYKTTTMSDIKPKTYFNEGKPHYAILTSSSESEDALPNYNFNKRTPSLNVTAKVVAENSSKPATKAKNDGATKGGQSKASESKHAGLARVRESASSIAKMSTLALSKNAKSAEDLVGLSSSSSPESSKSTQSSWIRPTIADVVKVRERRKSFEKESSLSGSEKEKKPSARQRNERSLKKQPGREEDDETSSSETSDELNEKIDVDTEQTQTFSVSESNFNQVSKEFS